MKKSLLLFILIFFVSCSNDESNAPSATALNLVTGITCRQTSDDITLQLGNPNVLVNNKFVIYPNPANEIVNIASTENITDIWLVPANPKNIYQNENFSSLLNSNLYSEQTIIDNSDLAINGQSSDGISLNISALEKGYYRVFVKIGGQMYWDNLYKYENDGSNQEQFAELTAFWE